MALRDAATPALRTEDSAVRLAAEPAPRGIKRKYIKKTYTLTDGDFSGDTAEYFAEEVSLATGSAVTADTELPTAAALADNTATPTAPAVGAFNMVFDGTNWDRQRSDGAATGAALIGGQGTAGTAAGGVVTIQGVASMTPVLVDTELPAAAALADATANPTTPSAGALLMGFNGTTWDRVKTGTGVVGTGVLRVTEAVANTATLANVADSASSVTLQASNASRIGWACFNDSTEILYIKFGATASTTSFTVRVAAGGYYEMPRPVYTGIIDGIWANDASGSARVTELT